MEQYNDPNRGKHFREHSDFVNELARLNSLVISEELVISVELIEFLRNSIINHIFITDKEMACYIITHENSTQ